MGPRFYNHFQNPIKTNYPVKVNKAISMIVMGMEHANMIINNLLAYVKRHISNLHVNTTKQKVSLFNKVL